MNSSIKPYHKSISKKKSNTSFGPSLSQNRPLEMKSQIKKVIHYDCINPINDPENDDDIPDENELYIKENLLIKKKEEDHDEDLSLININVSKLLSSSGSNSKEVNSLSKNSNSHNNTILTNYNKTPNISTNSKKLNYSSNNSIDLPNNKYSKKYITTKRKMIYDSLMKKSKPNSTLNSNKNCNNSKDSDNELKEFNDILNECEFNNYNENKSANPEVKITNITNIIVNVKNIGPKSFDMKSLATSNGKDFMMRDMKSLHLITQKALTATAKKNTVDSFDDSRTSFMNFRNSNIKNALFVNDNSDCNESGNKISSSKGNSNPSQIINIININSEYSVDDKEKKKGNSKIPLAKMTTKVNKKPPINTGYIHSDTRNGSESFRSSKTKQIKKLPGCNKTNKTLQVKDFINSIKSSKNNKKEYFISIGKTKK